MRTNFKMENKNITMYRGDTLAFGFEVMDENGDAFEQALDTVFFTCKSNKLDGINVFQKSLVNGIENAGNGQYKVRVAPSDTRNTEPGRYFYDLEIGVNGDIFTVMGGILEIEQDVTF